MYAIISFLILLTLIGAESSELISCLPTKLVGSGFLTKFYDYELSSKAGWEPGFFKSGYRTNVFGTKKGIHNIDFEHEGPWDVRSVYEFIYGQRTTYTNFVTEYTGYFFAKESGKYTFSLAANSGASLQLGSNGICCDDVLCSVTEDSSYALTTSKDGSRVSSKFVSFDLKKNLYYPMKLVYFNSQGDSSLSLRMKNPHGNVISDFSDYVWQVTFTGSICYTTVYGLWSGTSKTISTHKVANTKHHTETVHVLDPKPRSTATLTWDQPSTSTKIQDNGPTVMVVVYVPRLRTTIHEYWNGETKETDSFIGKDQVATIRIKHPRKRVHAFVTEDIPSTSIELIEDGETLRIIEHRPRETVTVEEFWNGETNETDSFIGDNQIATIRVKRPRKRVHAFVTEDRPSASTEFIEDGETLRIIEHRPRETVRVEEFWNGETNETDSFIGDDQVATICVKRPRKRVHAFVTEDIPSTSIELIEDGETLKIIEHRPRETVTVEEFWNGETKETDSFIGDNQIATIRVKHPRKRVHAFVTEDRPNTSTEFIEDGETLRIIEHRPRETVRVEEFWNGETNETDSFIGDNQIATIRVKRPRKRVHAFVTEDRPSTSTEFIEDGETLRIIEHRPRETVRVEEFWNGETNETDSFIGDNQIATIRVKHPRKRVHAFVTEDVPSTSIELIEDGETLRIIEHRPRETVRVEEFWNGETEETDSFIGDDQIATIRVKRPRKRVHAFVTEDRPSTSTEFIEDGETLRIIEHRPRETVRVEEFWNGETNETDSFIGDNEVATIRVKRPRKRVHAFVTEDRPSTSTEFIEDGETLRIIEHRPRETVRVEEFWNGETEETDSFIGDDQIATIRVKRPRKRVHAFVTEDIPSTSIELIEDGETLRIIEHRPRETVRVEEFWNGETNETDSFIGDDQVATIRVKRPRKRVHAFVTEDIPSTSIELIEDGETLRIIEHRPRETVRVEEFWNGETEETDSFIGDNQIATIRVKHPRKRVHAFVTEDVPSTSIELIEDGETLRIIEHRPRETVRVEEFWNGETEETDSFIGDDQIATIRIKHPRKRVHAFVTEDIPSTSIELIEDGETLRIIEHRPRETVRVEEFWNGETEETDSFIGDDQVATIRIKHPRKRVHAFVTEDIPSTSIELIEVGETLRIIEHRPRSIPPSDEFLSDIENTTETSAEADQMASHAVRNSRGHAVASGMEGMINSSSVETGVTNSVVEHELSQPVNATGFWDEENNHTVVPTGGDQVVALRPEIEELVGKANPFEVDLSDRANAALSPLYGLVSKQMTDFPSKAFEDLFGALEGACSSTKLESELEKSAGITKSWSNSVEDQIYDGSLLSVSVTTSTLASKKTDTNKFSVNGMSLNETERGLCFLSIFEAQSSQACETPFCEWDGSLTLPYTQVPNETDAHSNDSLELACNSEVLDRDKANLTRSEKIFRLSTALDKSGISSGDDARFVHLANSVVYSVSASSNSHSETRQENSDPVGKSLCPLSCPSLPRVSGGESATARITSLLSEPGTEISPVNYSPLSLNLPDLINAVNAGIVTESVNRTQPGNCKVPHCTSEYGVTSVGVEYDSGVERSPLDENLDSYATVICTDHCTLNVASSRLSNQSSDEQNLDFSPVSSVFDRSIQGFITFEKASSSLKLPTTTLKSSSQVVLFEGAACKMSLKMFTVAISLSLWIL